MKTIQAVADAIGAKVIGDASATVTGFSSLESVQADKLVFITKATMLEQLQGAKPAALITKAEWLPDADICALVVADPYVAYAKASQLFARKTDVTIGVHPAAIVPASVELGQQVRIAAGVVLGEQVVVGDHVYIGPNTVIGDRSQIGASSVLAANVTVYQDVTIGANCDIDSGAVIGGDGFGFARDSQGWVPIAQNGGVIIGDRVHIGNNSCIDCGAIDPTHIASDVIIDNQVHIAHNVEIGQFTAIAGCVGIAGSTKIGKNCQLAGAAAINGHIEVCDGVFIAGQARVTKSIAQPGQYSSGTPLMEVKLWRRAAALFSRSAKSKN